ncbi:MAG: hypothetical protein LBT04_02110 [Prevotellaceae bacterium]|jgi:predicted methyltransferase|nr:hypothetical protein [Prevotellaceae bacterium]
MPDCVLENFEHIDYVKDEVIYKNPQLPCLGEVIEFLASEKMIVIERNGIRITHKGKTMSEAGGYLKELLFERITFAAIIVASGCAVATLALTFYR